MSTFIAYAYFSLLFMLSFSITRIRSAFPYYCPNTTTYNPNSTYRSNLDQLLTTLSSNASRENGFYNYTIGRGPPDTVYGLFQCRGDVQTSACEQCVKTATTELLQNCPKEKRATIWYENCTLRFSNESIFSMEDTSYTVWSFNPDNITEEPNRFRKLVRQTMNEIEAVAATSDKKFATKIVNFTSYRKLYTLAQCTQDLSTADCDTCLQSLISKLGPCCDNKQGGRVNTQSCNIRYENYPFFESIPPPAPPPTANIPSIRPPPVSPSTTNQGNGGISKQDIIAIIIVPISVSLVLFFVGYFYLTRRTRKKPYDAVNDENDEPIEISWVESLQYDLNTIMIATNNFSADNKIGEGGFGSVYKGTFSNGQEIAVKRLSKNSTQGTKEFKNEVMVVAKLQHRNLVRLLGFCLEAEERILIYEFVPNKSLDYFLFDPEKRQMLNWLKRYHIIGGIARGLVYLHEDSRLRIIHRDLKASNILLDGDMNPKISDFGMARIFGVDQSQQNTSRIAGTYGYMSPEYVMYGQISIKSDVFSFGVLVLEIISGKKNNSFHRSDGSDNLISYAWNLWRNNRPLELMDLTMQNNYSENEVIRCIQIGLLCVQEDVDDRPNMPSILLALNSTFLTPLDVPRHPAFVLASTTSTTQRSPRAQNLDNSTSTSTAFSTNEASVSQLYPR